MSVSLVRCFELICLWGNGAVEKCFIIIIIIIILEVLWRKVHTFGEIVIDR